MLDLQLAADLLLGPVETAAVDKLPAATAAVSILGSGRPCYSQVPASEQQSPVSLQAASQ